jgi:drug/metabolite transporter (DMT)-like permease
MNLILALIFALISPFIWGLMNLIDKFSVAHKVKHPLGFTFVVAFAQILFGIILSLFLKWGGITFRMMVPSIIAGILLGVSMFFYYIFMKKEDASNLIGFIYLYPIVVIILSFLFLNEVISFIGYIGVFFILSGALILSLRMKKIGLKASLWLLFPIILFTGVNEFLIKVSTNQISGWNGTSIQLVAMGLTASSLLFNKNMRRQFKSEIKNYKWALLSETITLLAILTTYFAMMGLEATIVSSVAAIQPLSVLFYERLLHKRVGKITKDARLLPKLISILLIFLGVLLLYVPEVLKAIIS